MFSADMNCDFVFALGYFLSCIGQVRRVWPAGIEGLFLNIFFFGFPGWNILETTEVFIGDHSSVLPQGNTFHTISITFLFRSGVLWDDFIISGYWWLVSELKYVLILVIAPSIFFDQVQLIIRLPEAQNMPRRTNC